MLTEVTGWADEPGPHYLVDHIHGKVTVAGFVHPAPSPYDTRHWRCFLVPSHTASRTVVQGSPTKELMVSHGSAGCPGKLFSSTNVPSHSEATPKPMVATDDSISPLVAQR